MKRLQSTIIYFFISLFIALSLANCVKKDDFYDPSTSDPNRKTVVQITGSEDLIQYARDVDPAIDTFALIDLRRSPNASDGLNQSLTVKLVADPTAIDDYDTANSASFIVLPSDAYTLLDDINAVTFAPGEAVKQIKIRLDKSKISLSEQYALAFKVEDAGSGAVVNPALSSAIYSIGVKNKWDGVYTVTGSYADLTNPAFTGLYPYKWELQTNGPSSCVVVDNENLGAPGFLFNTGASNSYYGNFGLVINFDPVTNAVTSVTNYYGQPASNTRSASLDPTGVNAYDADTKTIKIKYVMTQPSVVPTPPNIRAQFDETWKYSGAR